MYFWKGEFMAKTKYTFMTNQEHIAITKGKESCEWFLVDIDQYIDCDVYVYQNVHDGTRKYWRDYSI